MGESAVPLRFLLKERTGEVHEALHRLPVFVRLARAEIGRAEYGRLIQRMESFYAALDPALVDAGARFSAPHDPVSHHRRAPHLASDRDAAGLPAERPMLAPPVIPGCPASYAGALYVVDGALLGGAMLGRAAARLDWQAPVGFWRWCRTEGPALWQRTLALIERVDGDETARRAAEAAATAVFASFADWMTRPADVSGRQAGVA